MSKEAKGGLMIMGAALFWGISGTVAKILFNNKMNPFTLANMRLNISFLILFVIMFFVHREKLKIKKADIKNFAIVGIFGIAAVQTTYYYTISALNVSMAIFLQYLCPIIITVYCVLFQNEKLNTIKIVALILAIVGSYLIIFGGGASAKFKTIGIITGIVCAFFSAFYTIFCKKCTSKYDSWTVLVYGLGFGAFAYWFVCPPWILWQGLDITRVLFILYIAFFATIIPFGLYMWGLSYLMPTPAGIISMLEPVVASLSAYLLIGETMSILQILGAVSIIAAVISLQMNSKKVSEKLE